MSSIIQTFEEDLKLVQSLASTIKDDFNPELIVGIVSGGLIPSLLMSKELNVPMYTLDVRLHNKLITNTESNTWLAEWSFGYEEDPKRILILDDYVNTGQTIQWIKDDWQSVCLPDSDKWNAEIWHKTTRFACLGCNVEGTSYPDYFAESRLFD